MSRCANGYPQERIVAYDHDGAGVDIAGQAHVEVATWKESFAMQYEFLVGGPPEVVDIAPQRQPVELSGRAVNFPQNTGRQGATLDIWKVDSATGARVDIEPDASFDLGTDGAFGPVVVQSGAHYEYALSTPTSGSFGAPSSTTDCVSSRSAVLSSTEHPARSVAVRKGQSPPSYLNETLTFAR